MSMWTYINGTITVSPIGRTQAEKRYILETVLDHLPIVSGSERDMDIYINQKNGFNVSSSSDEFGLNTNLLTSNYGNKTRYGWLRMQDNYILTVDGSLRDREFHETYREFMKWLIRLGKRVMIENVLIEIKDYGKSAIIKDRCVQNEKHSYENVFMNLFENPSYGDENVEPAWAEYLMWDRAKNSRYPMLLQYKYFADEENDREVERRYKYMKKKKGDE